MSSLIDFFNNQETENKGLLQKNNIIKRNIIAYMAVNGESTLAELTKELRISVPTITKLVQELCDEGIVTDLGNIRDNKKEDDRYIVYSNSGKKKEKSKTYVLASIFYVEGDVGYLRLEREYTDKLVEFNQGWYHSDYVTCRILDEVYKNINK